MDNENIKTLLNERNIINKQRGILRYIIPNFKDNEEYIRLTNSYFSISNKINYIQTKDIYKDTKNIKNKKYIEQNKADVYKKQKDYQHKIRKFYNDNKDLLNLEKFNPKEIIILMKLKK